MPEPLVTALGRLLYEPALPVETPREIVGLSASLPAAVAWYTCAE